MRLAASAAADHASRVLLHLPPPMRRNSTEGTESGSQGSVEMGDARGGSLWHVSAQVFKPAGREWSVLAGARAHLGHSIGPRYALGPLEVHGPALQWAAELWPTSALPCCAEMLSAGFAKCPLSLLFACLFGSSLLFVDLRLAPVITGDER